MWRRGSRKDCLGFVVAGHISIGSPAFDGAVLKTEIARSSEYQE